MTPDTTAPRGMLPIRPEALALLTEGEQHALRVFAMTYNHGFTREQAERLLYWRWAREGGRLKAVAS